MSFFNRTKTADSTKVIQPFVFSPTSPNTSWSLDYAKGWAWNCATRNAASIASQTPHLYVKYPSGSEREITNHPFFDLLDSAGGTLMDRFSFMEETSLWLDCHGNAYWLVDYSSGGLMQGLPSSLTLIPSTAVQAEIASDGTLKGYRIYNGGSSQLVPESRMLHFRRPSLQSQVVGMGRIESSFLAISTESERQKYERGLFQNKGVNELLITPQNGGTVTPAQRREMSITWLKSLTSWLPKILPADFKIEKISFSPREMIALQSRTWNMEEIMGSFGQPKGIWESATTRATADAAQYQWAKYELDATLTRFSQKITSDLLKQYDSRLVLKYDSCAGDDDLQQSQIDVAEIQAGIVTIDEVRATRGLPPLPKPVVKPGVANGIVQEVPQ